MVTYLTIRFTSILLVSLLFGMNFLAGAGVGKVVASGRISIRMAFILMLVVVALSFTVLAVLL